MNLNNNKKKEVLKLLKTIGIDTRFISYTDEAIYINDQRFSKFSKKRQETFKKYYPEMEVISSSLLQKICIRASKVLSNELCPKDKILIFKPKNDIDKLLNVVLEPYSRKYGIKIIESESESSKIKPYSKEIAIDAVVKSLTLDEKVENLLSNIFSGNGIGNVPAKEENEKFKVIYPFINIPNTWINTFNSEIQRNYKTTINYNNNYYNPENYNNNQQNNKEPLIIAKSFMEFIDNIIPQYKENLLKSSIFIENEYKLKNK